MIDQNYISLTFTNLKTIYNRTCKECCRVENTMDEDYQADKEQLEIIKNSISSLMEWCCLNTSKLK